MSLLARAALVAALLFLGAPAKAGSCNPSSDPHDLMVRTVMGEAAGQPYEGKVAVAAVIRTRVLSGRWGHTVRDVVLARKQFEPWGRRCRELMRLSPESPGWAEASRAVDAALAADDPTAGATHFAAVHTVRKRRNRRGLSWIAQLTSVCRIGSHTFGRSL